MTFLGYLFLLLIGHAVADFALQSPVMARAKNRHMPPASDSIPPGQKVQATWFYFLTAHALIHAGAVYIITGSLALAFWMFGVHWLIDFLKCESLYGIHEDQAMHLASLMAIAYVVSL